MDFIKRISITLVSIVLLGNLFTYTADATLSSAEQDAIIQNCSHIKQSLTKLQYADSRTRTYLGSAYESIITRFITPLNLRLVKNNKTTNELFQIQNDFVSAQSDFRDQYVKYMRELENVIATDCSAHPDDFYAKLSEARTSRASLQKTTKKLSELASKQYSEVEKLSRSL